MNADVQQPLEELFGTDQYKLIMLEELDEQGRPNNSEASRRQHIEAYWKILRSAVHLFRKQPDERYSLTGIVESAFASSATDKIARMNPYQGNDRQLLFTGMRGTYPLIGPFYEGLINTAILFADPQRSGSYAVSPEWLHITEPRALLVSDSDDTAPAYMPNAIRSGSEQGMTAVKKYLDAIGRTITRDIAYIGEHRLVLKWAYPAAASVAMCLLGAAKGVELIIQKAQLEAEEEEMAAALSKRAYGMPCMYIVVSNLADGIGLRFTSSV